MTVDKQPRALYLADVLAAGFECDQEWYEIESAKELRRLHAENEDYGATCDHLIRENAEHIGKIVALKEQRDELLEALIDMVDYYGTASANVQQLDAAKSAIAKATGETK